jgi:hypothetical protein
VPETMLPDLDKMNLKELRAYALSIGGSSITRLNNKAQLREAISCYAKLKSCEGGPYLQAKLVPTHQGDFAYLDWEAVHLPTEE